MRLRTAIFGVLVAFTIINSYPSKNASNLMAQEPPSWSTKKYHVLEDGNQLYSECQSVQQNTTISDGVAVHLDVTREQVLEAGACWGYVKAIVDSIPGGEGFEPGSDVRINQYI